MTVAVLDIGKTNVKANAVTAQGVVLETVSTPNVSRDGPPYRHCDLGGLEDWCLEALAALNARHGLTHIVVTGHGSAGVLVDETGPMMPMIDYEQDAPADVTARYRAEIGPYEERGSAIMHGATHQARQMLWLESGFPEAFARARAYLGLPQYFAFRMSGVAVSEVTMLAAQSHLWDTANGRWSQIVERRGWRRLMAPMRRAFETIGTLRADLARRHGLPETLRVLAGIHDSSANHYRYKAAGIGEAALLSTGTWLVGLSAATPLDRLDEARGMTLNADIDGRPVAGALTMGGREFAAIAADAADSPATPGDIARLVENGTMALPSFGGDDGLFPGSAGKGRVIGPTPATPSQAKALALVYAALLADACLDALAVDGPVVLDGSFVRDPLFPALLAAFRPQARLRYNLEASGIAAGAALLVGHAQRTGPAPIALETPATLHIDGLAAYRRRWHTHIQHDIAVEADGQAGGRPAGR